MALSMNSFSDTMLRQRVVAQIEAAREGCNLDPTANSSEEMENVLYENAKSREEYMQLIASLVLHLNAKKKEALDNGGQQHFEQVQEETQEECNGETAEAAAAQKTHDDTSQSATNS